MSSSLFVQYTLLLHEHRDPQAVPVRQFVEQHSANKKFMRRVAALNRIWNFEESTTAVR